MDYADELFFECFDVADEDFLVERDAHGQEEHGAVGADVGCEGVFGNVLTIGTAGDDEDGQAEEDALNVRGGKGMVPEEGVEPTRGVIPGRF